MVELKVKSFDIKKIYQISDIHIRIFKRKSEYEEVFNNLYIEINKSIDSESIIVVTGDIFHNKLEMGPEQIQIASDFIKSLAKIAPTIIIPGNHDANLANKNRMDCITPIVNAINNDNLFYLKNTGLYRLNNVVFSHMSVFDDVSSYIQASLIDFDDYKIALYHGTINNSVTDLGWKIQNSSMSTNFFDGYDIALIGDIHKRQLLQSYSVSNGIKKPHIEYPGSLIQQNFGESVDNHGMLIWNLPNKTVEFVAIKNSYGFATCEINSGKIDNLDNLPEKCKVRFVIKDTTEEQLKQCIFDFKRLYKFNEIYISKSTAKLENKYTIDSANLSKIRDINFQNDLLTEYFNTAHIKVDGDVLSKILNLNSECNAKLPVLDIIRNVVWTPKIFKFSNMFSYGENNIINFENMNGIVGIFASNAEGKTSIIESLTFCLFDKCSKTFKANNILNNRKNNFYCELTLTISGIDYVIRRSASKSASGNVSVSVDFYRIETDGTMTSLRGEHRRDTDSIIKSYIGTYDDFVLTTVSSQNNNANFIDKSLTEKKDLFNSFMDITIFDELYEIANNDIKEYQVLLKQHNKNDYNSDLKNYSSLIDEYTKQYSEFKLSKESVLDKKNEISDIILSKTELLVPIQKFDTDIENMKLHKSKIEAEIISDKSKIQSIQIEYDSLKLQYDGIIEQVSKYESDDILKKYNDYISIKEKFSDIDVYINNFKLKVTNKMEKTKKLRELEYDPNCNFCMNNIFVKDAILAKDELENDKLHLKDAMINRQNLLSKMDEMKYIESDYLQYNNNLTESKKVQIAVLKSEAFINNIKSSINSLELKLNNCINNIDLYYKNESHIQKNKIISDEILSLKGTLSEHNITLNHIDSQMMDLHSKINTLQDKYNNTINILNEIRDMQEKTETYKYYMQAIHRDSIPYTLISKTIPVIESEINQILSHIVDFGVILELDDKNINAKIAYDADRIWSIDMASGMEKFIAGMAIRISLINITNLPKSNFLAIDEGWSSLDPDNSSNLPILLDQLKHMFDFILIISHQDHMRDFSDITLDLKKDESGYSSIIYQ